MGDEKTRKLEDRINSLQKEAETYKHQSYDQAALLLDLIAPLSRLGYAANPTVVDSALSLARDVSKQSQDVDAIREAADIFLDVYKTARNAGSLEPHDTVWRKSLASAVEDLPIEPETSQLVTENLQSSVSLAEALAPLAESLQSDSLPTMLDATACERLAAMISTLPLEKMDLMQAGKLSSRLLGGSVDFEELEEILDELASLLGHALQSTMKRDQQMQRLVTQMSGELSVVEGFLGALSRRDDASLAEAVSVQTEVGETSDGMEAVFDSGASLLEIRSDVLTRAHSIRVRMDRYAAEAKAQRAMASQDTAQLAGRLSTLESELQNTRDELEHVKELATHDFLTGLHNRRAFEDATKQWLADAKPGQKLCCIIWDIDLFKKVNDNHGHVVGDSVLCSVASVLKDRVGDQDLAARLGGEEFVTVIREADASSVLKWANDVRIAIASMSHDADGEMISVSVSCGIAEYMRSDNLTSILARADKALYRAKDEGRNLCLFAA